MGVGGKAKCNRLKEARSPPGCKRAPVTLGHSGGERGQPGWRSAEERREGRGRVFSKCNPGTEMDKQQDLGPPPGQKAWPGNL